MKCLWHGESIEIAILMTMLYKPRHEKKNNRLVSAWSDTNQAVQLEKMARGLNFGVRK